MFTRLTTSVLVCDRGASDIGRGISAHIHCPLVGVEEQCGGKAAGASVYFLTNKYPYKRISFCKISTHDYFNTFADDNKKATTLNMM